MLGMRRREFISLLGGAAAAWPLAARAQQGQRMRRIGVLLGLDESDADARSWVTAFRQRLDALGWTDGHNARIDYRFAGADAGRIRAHATELVGLTPDLIFISSQPAFDAAREATRTIPIVFVQISDPVVSGFVASLARPGGNITGFTSGEFERGEKWLELLKEIAPRVAQVTVVLDLENATNVGQFRAIEGVAPSFGVQLTKAGVHDAAEIERALEVFARKSNAGLIVLANPVTVRHRELITSLAVQHRLPSVYPYRLYVTSGGLASYGPDLADLYRSAASYVDRILRGEKPGDLPIQQPTKFELVINLKTARALGFTVPPSLLARADEVIE
jgi:putative tryptophan/tyrosine transport system substrate-binding protein